MFRLFQLSIFLSFFVLLAGCSDDSSARPDDSTNEDAYVGRYSEITLSAEGEGLPRDDVRLIIQAPDGHDITRQAVHRRNGATSVISMSKGLKSGIYRLQAVEKGDVEVGLGSRIRVSDKGIEVIDFFDSQLGYAGRGSKEDPYIISSPST